MLFRASLISAWPRLLAHAIVLVALGAIWAAPRVAAPAVARHLEVTPAVQPPSAPLVAMARRARVATALPVVGAAVTSLPPPVVTSRSTPARPAHGGAVSAQAATFSAARPGWGNDISWPQCGGAFPTGSHDLGVVGVTGGRPFTSNPCLGAEFAWARNSRMPGGAQLYVNLEIDGTSTGPHHCGADDHGCRAYDYGMATVFDAIARAEAAGVNAGFWWLDVELGNYWSDTNLELNQAIVQGAIDAARSRGVDVGIYSSVNQWAQIVPASYRPGVPTWLAVVGDSVMAPGLCAARHSFTGGPVYVVQYDDQQFDKDHVCATGAAGFAYSGARKAR